MLLAIDNVNVHHKSNNGATLLHLASMHGHGGIDLLLRERSDIVVENGSYSGRTPLSVASQCGSLEVVKMLINKLPNPKCVDTMDKKEKKTPLCWVSQVGHPEVVKVLLESGANINHKDALGWTPFD